MAGGKALIKNWCAFRGTIPGRGATAKQLPNSGRSLPFRLEDKMSWHKDWHPPAQKNHIFTRMSAKYFLIFRAAPVAAATGPTARGTSPVTDVPGGAAVIPPTALKLFPSRPAAAAAGPWTKVPARMAASTGRRLTTKLALEAGLARPPVKF